jgi:hypothetical protein
VKTDPPIRQGQDLSGSWFLPAAPLDSPACWTGHALQSAPEEWLMQVTDDDAEEVARATRTALDRELRIDQISPRTFELPRFGPKLKRLGRNIADGRGCVLLRGLGSDRTTEEARTAFFGISTYLGIPLGQSRANDILGDVRNETSVVDRNTRGYKAGDALAYHTDGVDIVGLYCVRPAKSGGVSKVVSGTMVHNIVMEERPDLLAVLYDEPCFYSLQSDAPEGQLSYYWFRSFSWYRGMFWTRWLPKELLTFQDDMPELPRMSSQLREALEFTAAVANREELALDMDFQTGDIQYLNDAVIWHSRTPYVDEQELHFRRHLLRVWLNSFEPRPAAPDLENLHDMLGDAAIWPRRRVYDVPVFHSW